MSDAVAQLESLLHDQPKNPLRPEQVKEYHEELRRLGALSEGRDMDGQRQSWVPGNKASARKSAQNILNTLKTQTAKPIEEPMRRDAVHKLAADVMANVIAPALLPRAHMQRNPAGAVDLALQREYAKPIKRAILTWKRALRALEPDNDAPNYTNVERFRSEGGLPGTSTFMAEAQLPGNFAMTPQAKENWPLGDPVTTALEQVRARERAMTPEERQAKVQFNAQQRRARYEAKNPGRQPGRRPSNLTPEQRKALGERLKAAREAKRAAVQEG